MVDEIIYDELCCTLMTREQIIYNSQKNGETPFGYVLDYIKDMYNVSKTEGWDTAKKVCEYFGLGVSI